MDVRLRRPDGSPDTTLGTLDAGEPLLARELVFVFPIEGVDTYILVPRDPTVLDLLVSALRPTPRQTDIDVVIGVRGPLAPPELANGLVLPIVAVDNVYSFDIDSLIQSIPRPEAICQEQFGPAAEEIFSRLVQVADNAGATPEHRALNYVALRSPAPYAQAADCFARNLSLSEVTVRPSRLTGPRDVQTVIFRFRNRETDVEESYAMRVDVTDKWPFLVSKLGPWYERLSRRRNR